MRVSSTLEHTTPHVEVGTAVSGLQKALSKLQDPTERAEIHARGLVFASKMKVSALKTLDVVQQGVAFRDVANFSGFVVSQCSKLLSDLLGR